VHVEEFDFIFNNLTLVALSQNGSQSFNCC